MARAVAAKRKSVKVDKEALYEAQDLIYKAYETRTAKQQIALAKKALTISPFCADAYVMLAEYMPSASDEGVLPSCLSLVARRKGGRLSSRHFCGIVGPQAKGVCPCMAPGTG